MNLALMLAQDFLFKNKTKTGELNMEYLIVVCLFFVFVFCFLAKKIFETGLLRKQNNTQKETNQAHA
jgi:hypothetical protein